MKFITGLILIGSGMAIIRYRYQIYNFTGDWAWAVKFLGGNGTVVAISLIGMLLIAGGTAYPFGVLNFGSPNTQDIPAFNVGGN